ncbi:hypothetical protein GCM10010182_40780 [Actinomadura cremea]|nr:hypothetical protein GCM10010182_40780 [Actinomadura cremea]
MNRARVHTDRAEMLLDLHRPADAEREARAALAADPENAPAHLLLARALSRRSDVQGALDAVDRYVAMRPEDWVGHWRAGFVLYTADRDREALTAFLHAREHAPAEPSVHRMLAWTHHALGEAAHARSAAEHGLRLAPDDAYLAAVLALALLELRDKPGAREQAERALSLAPEDPYVHRWYGTVALATGRPRAAADAFRESLRADPDWPGGPAAILEAERRRNPLDLDRAVAWFRDAPRRTILLFLALSGVAPCLLVNVVVTLLIWANWSMQAGVTLWLGRDPRVRPLLRPAELRAAAISVGLLLLGAALLAVPFVLHEPSAALPAVAVLALVTPVQETAGLDGRRRVAFAVLTAVLAGLAIASPFAPWAPIAVLCLALGSTWPAMLISRNPW